MTNNEIQFEIQHLTPVIMDLLYQEKRKMAFEMLEMYFKRARTIEDFDTLGYLSLKAEHRDLYLKCAEAAYLRAENSQQLYIARANLYRAYNALNLPEKALFYVNLNLQIDPNDFDALTQKAFSISFMGDKKTSEKMLMKILEKFPERKDDLRSSMSGKLLREGKTTEGILSFLGTFKPKSGKFDDVLKMKRWTGTIQPGKTIYVEGEGGIGDEIINIRFFKNLEKLGMKPILYSTWSKYREDTVNMFRRNGYDVVTETFSIDRKQLWAPMMSLPAYLNLDESKLWNGPYLTSLNNPKNKIQSKKFKIGIKCSGNPYFQQDEYRKIPLAKMLEYLPKDAEIYYIDKESVNDPNVIDLSSKIESWEDTLDLIEQMDCIVSSCTSLVHAAGALGKKTFVVVPIAEYYIWTTSITTTKSPWYGDNFQVHKQTKLRSWDEPLQNVKKELLAMMNDETKSI
jgi:DNA-directed RNA polymerase subunit F